MNQLNSNTATNSPNYMTNGPKLWAEILTRLNPYFSKAVVAGGCIRDFRLAVRPKDIDVFVDFDTEIEMEMMTPELKKLGFDVSVFEAPLNFDEEDRYQQWAIEDDSTIGIVGILDGWYRNDDGELPIQIIARSYKDFSPENVVADFDYAVVKGWFDLSYGLTVTEAMESDLRELKVTMVRKFSEDRKKRSEERFDRFNKRHDDRWTFVPWKTSRRTVNSQEYFSIKPQPVVLEYLPITGDPNTTPWVVIED